MCVAARPRSGRAGTVKAEALHADGRCLKENARFVVTNVRHKPERAWGIYCQHGNSENWIKELKHDLDVDRTSCSNFTAHQVLVLWTAAAFALFQELPAEMQSTALARATVATLRLRLLKIGATVTGSVRRFVVSMSSSHRWKDLWRRAANRIVAMA